MPRYDLEYFTYTHPRRSSDYCLQAESPASGPLRAVYGVSDMIGHPRGLNWGNYMKTAERQLRRRLADAPVPDVEALAELVAAELARHNGHIRFLRDRHDQSAFGFCVCVACVHGAACRVSWLGDCRAYLLRRRRPDRAEGPPVRVRCLTRDQNRLGRILQERGEFVLFRNEMLELGKHLDCYLGVADDDLVRRTLAREHATLELGERDCLLLVTDGFYLPMARALLEVSNYRLTRESYRLEEWMENVLAVAVERAGRRCEPEWRDLAGALVEHARHSARKAPHYRDDMAVLGLHLPAG